LESEHREEEEKEKAGKTKESDIMSRNLRREER
jgi:hypothetical protein